MFEELVDGAIDRIEDDLECDLEVIPLNSWFLIEHDGKVGGFYSRNSYGYCDIPGFAFTATPVGEQFKTDDDKALELARGYLHDCFHASTFRSYGVKRGGGRSSPKAPPTVYRFQHGFNFRTIEGVSYSAPPSAVTNGSINLGVLMDGIGSILAGEALKTSLGYLKTSSLSAELVEDVACVSPIPNGKKFFADVIVPTRNFFKLYNKIPMTGYAKVMISGEFSWLKAQFEDAYGVSWEVTFRQKDFPDQQDRGVPRPSHMDAVSDP